VGRVAAGAIAKKLLRTRWGVEILACVIQLQDLCAAVNPGKVTFAEIEANPERCPDPALRHHAECA
jgi:chorismate synthase